MNKRDHWRLWKDDIPNSGSGEGVQHEVKLHSELKPKKLRNQGLPVLQITTWHIRSPHFPRLLAQIKILRWGQTEASSSPQTHTNAALNSALPLQKGKNKTTKTHKCPLHQFSNPSLSLAHSWTQLRRHLKHTAWLFYGKGPVQHAAPLPVPTKTKSRELRLGSSGAQTSDKNFIFKNGNSSNLFCYF